jgi:cysteinyl-tRNA synthetase
MLKKYISNIILVYIFSKHYREAFKISEAELEKFESIHETIGNTTIIKSDSPTTTTTPPQSDADSKPIIKFIMHMEDNFDTPHALELMIQVTKRRERLADLNYMVRIFALRY